MQAQRIHFTLGYSRAMMAKAAFDQKLGTLLMREEAFRKLGDAPEEILYDRMKTVWVGIDKRRAMVWSSRSRSTRSAG